MRIKPKFKVGQRVFDGPSQMLTTIAEVKPENNNDPDDGFVYRVADDVPDDPTGDRAFPDRWRNDFEICFAEEREKLTPFEY